MHDEIVERRKWISNGRFLHALNYCMLLPGPEAQQLAIYIGWLLHKVRGGLVAGIMFVLPSFFVMLGAVVALRRAWRRDVGERDLLRPGRGRGGDRCLGHHPHRQEGARERAHGGRGGGLVRLDLPAASAVPADHPGRRCDRPGGGRRPAGAVPRGDRTRAGGERRGGAPRRCAGRGAHQAVARAQHRRVGRGSCVLADPDRGGGSVARPRRHAHGDGVVLQQGGAGDVRWGLRGPVLHQRGRGGAVRMAVARDRWSSGWAWPRPRRVR